MNIAIRSLLEVQETSLLVARAARRLFRRPTYFNEMVAQADVIGVGSLTIIILTGFFTGGVLTLQTYPTLKYYGAQTRRAASHRAARDAAAVDRGRRHDRHTRRRRSLQRTLRHADGDVL